MKALLTILALFLAGSAVCFADEEAKESPAPDTGPNITKEFNSVLDKFNLSRDDLETLAATRPRGRKATDITLPSKKRARCKKEECELRVKLSNVNKPGLKIQWSDDATMMLTRDQIKQLMAAMEKAKTSGNPQEGKGFVCSSEECRPQIN